MINDATEKVAAGDFTVRVQLDEHVQIEEFQELFRSFNLMVEELGTVETLRDGFVALRNVSSMLRIYWITVGGLPI